MFSKKATKIAEIFTVDLTLCSNCQIDGEDCVDFCALLRKRELYEKLFGVSCQTRQKSVARWAEMIVLITYVAMITSNS